MHPDQQCPLDPRLPRQREPLPNLTRLDCEIVDDGNTIIYIGRDPATLDIIEVGMIDKSSVKEF